MHVQCRSNNRILITFIFHAGLYNQVYAITLSVYAYNKGITFPYKTALFHGLTPPFPELLPGYKEA